MVKTILCLLVAVIGNALGTALMANTDLGLTAWGSAAKNFSLYFDVTFGTGFIILAIFFYVIAVIVRRKIIFIETILSFGFLFSFGFLSDFFIEIIPSMTHLNLALRLLINFSGLCILLFSIAIHLKILIAVHPCDVFLYEMQQVFKSDSKGTYFTYFTAFSIAVIFGLLSGKITGIGIGTVITLLSSGILIRFFNRTILKKL